MKNNKNILVAIGLILSILIGIFFYNSYKSIQAKKIAFEQKKQEEDIKKQEEEEINQEIGKKLDDLEISGTLNLDSESESEEVNTSSETSTGVTLNDNLSEQSKIRKENVLMLTFSNVEQCDILVYLKEECKSRFLYFLAVDELDLKYCDKLTDDIQKTDCRDDIYYKTNTCRSIKNTFLKSKCESNTLDSKELLSNQTIINNSSKVSDTSKCSLLETYYEKQACLKNIIVNTQNIDLCKSFYANTDEQTSCIKNVSYDFNREIINEAFTTKNLSVCDKITDESTKKQCKSMTF